jgi:hypothetical protein
MAALTFKVGGDTSGLSRAVSSAKGMLLGLGNVIKSGALAGGAVAIGGLTTAVVGLKKALDLGGRLSDVSANTGLLAGEAMVLERALSDAGIGGEKLQATIQKMQKSIVEAGDGLITPKRALDELGLSVGGLLTMRPAEQFAAIQEALAGLSDPAERSARAMQIFGRSGGELGALFSNPEAMKNAAESVGTQAEILNKSAGEFDRSADILAGIGDKIRSFFVGLAGQLNSVLLPLLEQLNKVDFAKIGTAFGEGLMVILEAFKTGVLGELLKNSFLFGASFLVNAVVEGFATAGQILMKAAVGVGDIISNIFSSEKVAAFFKMMKLGAFQTIFPDIPSIPNPFGREALQAKEDQLIKEARDAADRVEGGVESIFSDFKKLPSLMDSDKFQKDLGETIKPLLEIVRERAKTSSEQNRLNSLDIGTPSRASLFAGENKSEEEKKDEDRFSFKLLKPIVSSLGRVGGDGNRGQSVIFRMDKERNKLLKDIAFNTGNGTTAVYG